MKLVDSLAEQDLLEEVIERSKPAVPVECRHLRLHLLATPIPVRRSISARPRGLPAERA